MKLDTMKELRRTHYCAEVPHTTEEVVVCGFADRVRDMGNLIFINLRDRTGIVQLAFNDSTDRAVFEKAGLLQINGERVSLTEEGMLVSNMLLASLLPD